MREEITSLIADFEKSTIKKRKDELKQKLPHLMSVRNSCTRLRDDLLQIHVAIQKVLGRQDLSFIAHKKCQEKIQQSETYLKEKFPYYMFTVNGKSEYFVKIPSDSGTCWIAAICVLPDGQVLVVDRWNNKVKLLNQQYQVVSHCGVNSGPVDICQITPNEVALTVDDDSNTHEVQFITVNKSVLVLDKKLQLQHFCRGIAHHHGDLFITSQTALYKYSMSGKLVCRLYEDISGGWTVCSCAMSPTGDKLYITSPTQHKLLTLARDGTVLATYTDPELRGPEGVHVTPAGQVLVCGEWSNNILQVDSQGRKKLATLATWSEGVEYPVSVCYSSRTSSFIVGQLNGNKLLVIRVE